MDCPIYILAEGRSSRMGSDKGLVKINGKEMILHCIENLNLHQKGFQNLSGLNLQEQKVTIITSNTEYEKFGHRIISDKVKDQGPAQGVITALEDCQSDQCVIVSCDMPFVDDSLIRLISDEFSNAEICCFASEFVFPFPGVFSKKILFAWKEKVAAGNLKMQSLIKQFDYKSLPIEQADLFLNVNTPEDILLVEQKLK